MVKTYVVDIDGTICSQVCGNYEKAEPFLDRIRHFNQLFDQGNKIIYYTSRGMTTGLDWTALTKQQLDSWGVKYTGIRMNKLAYDVWIDDKAHNVDWYFTVLSAGEVK